MTSTCCIHHVIYYKAFIEANEPDDQILTRVKRDMLLNIFKASALNTPSNYIQYTGKENTHREKYKTIG